jgi:hypothetical protein
MTLALSPLRPLLGIGFLVACAVILPAEEPKKQEKKRSKSVNVVNDAYRVIKERRNAVVDKYVEALMSIAEDCVKDGLVQAGTEITERALKVVEPPKNRRKVRAKAVGVGLDKKGQIKVHELEESLQKAPNPEETARWVDVKKRVDAIRAKLKAGPSEATDGQTAQPKPLDLDDEPAPASKEDKSKQKASGSKPKPKPKSKTSVEGGAADAASAPGAPEGKAKESGKLDREVRRREKQARLAAMKAVEKLADRCVRQGFPAHGYELLLWALQIDPDNESLRRIVRQHPHTDKSGKKVWYSPFELAKAKAGYIDHPEYGWVTPAEQKALESGKLWYKNQWQPRDFVEQERQKWENRWTHQTEHFEISTNASLRDAVEFGREVERLYSFFFRMFYDFYTAGTGSDGAKLVFGGGKDLGDKKLKLNYYRSREHYISEVKKDPDTKNLPPGEIALVSQSAGFYWGHTGKAYFYRGPDGPDLSVIYHEVTHQLFGETYDKGPQAPTWLVEAFGVFMEDPLIRGERLIAGAEIPPGIRKQNIRDINDFVKNYQNHNKFHGEVRTDNYATAGAVVHFFLFFRGGLYRQAFIKYAREAYRNTQDDSPTHIKKLYEYLGIPENKLQEDWEAFNNTPDLFDF